MRLYNHGLRSVALLLTVLLVVYTVPVSAAEGTSRASIGQVSANGAVDLRGVRINGDGTLFSGDRMNVGTGAYAKVALGAGPKIEVGSGSDVTVTREADRVQVMMASGNVAFKGDGKAAIHLRIGAFEVTVPGDASGNVAFVGKDVFGVRVLTGSVGVRNTSTKQSYVVQKGSDRLISLQTGLVNQPLAQLASTAPSAVPALPAPQTAGAGLSRGGWIAVLGTVAGAAVAVIVLTTRNDDTDDDAATRLAQVRAIQNLNAIASTATATNTLTASVSVSANSALSTIANSSASTANKATLTNAANAIISKANSAAAKIAILNPKIAALQNTISNQEGGPTAQQQTELNGLLAELEAARLEGNGALTDLNNLVTLSASLGVTLQSPGLQPVNGPVIASASVPN